MKKKSGCCFGFFSAFFVLLLLILFVGAIAVGSIRILNNSNRPPSRMLVSKQIPLCETITPTLIIPI